MPPVGIEFSALAIRSDVTATTPGPDSWLEQRQNAISKPALPDHRHFAEELGHQFTVTIR